jgi:hypothetical protein
MGRIFSPIGQKLALLGSRCYAGFCEFRRSLQQKMANGDKLIMGIHPKDATPTTHGTSPPRHQYGGRGYRSLNYAAPGIDSFSELRTPIPLGPGAARALGNLRTTSPAPAVKRTSRAFGQDLETETRGVSGEDRSLRSIVQGPFATADWEKARDELDRYLAIHRGPLAEARARYYRGQALYFLGSYRAAFFEFLLVKDYFPVEAREWMESCLAALLN